MQNLCRTYAELMQNLCRTRQLMQQGAQRLHKRSTKNKNKRLSSVARQRSLFCRLYQDELVDIMLSPNTVINSTDWCLGLADLQKVAAVPCSGA